MSFSVCRSTPNIVTVGKRRETNWQPMGLAAIEGFNTDITNRGFTGHEQIDSVGLIHMNGRVYDAELGRFLSADPNVQALDNLQNFNRYSYVLNNPLSYTDPTGFFFAKLFKAIGRAFGKIFSAIGRAFKKLLRSPIFRAIIQIIACSNPVTCVAASGAMAAAEGGSLGDVFKAMAMSFVQMQVWNTVGSFLDPIAKSLNAVGKAATAAGKAAFAAVKGVVHGIVGGALAVAQGGNFLAGFASNALGAVAGVLTQGSDLIVGTAISAAAGCAGAVIGGGKCANGAVTAAFAYLYNQRRILKKFTKKPSQAPGTVPGDVFIPGTKANDQFVTGVFSLGDTIGDQLSKTKAPTPTFMAVLIAFIYRDMMLSGLTLNSEADKADWTYDEAYAMCYSKCMEDYNDGLLPGAPWPPSNVPQNFYRCITNCMKGLKHEPQYPDE